MKKISVVIATICMFSVAQAQEVYKPAIVKPIAGTHCDTGAGSRPPMAYDAKDHLMQCSDISTNGTATWQYVAEGDGDRIIRKLDELNATNVQILAALTKLLAVQTAGAGTDSAGTSRTVEKPVSPSATKANGKCDLNGYLTVDSDGNTLMCREHYWVALSS
ncbi:hypothetical protein QZM25_32030 [Burkholderia contaminans]|uniref:hypothetical protein n=1 Tax=Burkholderia contaminans TaxID=488447 RepID=UPI001CF58827|nr:hypothetical protein [Burkholderia contaminans]MCA7889673.1 hypothetical protein [Burkholderia contaminans]MDN7577245.1 hypothetical protein [Burkholderia contaminans]